MAFDFGAAGNMKRYNQVSGPSPASSRFPVLKPRPSNPCPTTALCWPDHPASVSGPGHEGSHSHLLRGSGHAGGPQRRGRPRHTGESTNEPPASRTREEPTLEPGPGFGVQMKRESGFLCPGPSAGLPSAHPTLGTSGLHLGTRRSRRHVPQHPEAVAHIPLERVQYRPDSRDLLEVQVTSSSDW